MTLAAVLTFVAYRDASAAPTTAYAVATRALDAGTTLQLSDVELVRMSLPRRVAGGAFSDVAELAGRRLLAPLDTGDLVQGTIVTEPAAGAAGYQASIAVPRAFALAGLLRRGDLVDVLLTDDTGSTRVVAAGVRVLATSDADDRIGASNDAVLVVELRSSDDVAAVIGAARSGDVSLARSTFAPAASRGVQQ